MPVSKKRKKEGKPVHRHTPEHPVEEHHDRPEAKPAASKRAGKPSNPFVAQQQGAKRGAQRGR